MNKLGGYEVKNQNFSVGVDIEDISRFNALDSETTRALFKGVFTEKEKDYCFSKAKPSQHFAVRFAGKEAVIKVLSGLGERINISDIEILNDTKSMPFVNLKDDRLKNIEISISLSHCSDKAGAFCLGVKK